MTRPAGGRFTLAAVTMGLAAPPVQAQVGPTSAPTGFVGERVAIVVDSALSTVGFALHLPARPDAGGGNATGAAHLVSLALQDELQERAAALAAEVRVEVDPWGTVISAQAAPDAIADLVDAVGLAAFESPLGTVHLENRRAELLAQLSFASGAPVRDFEREARRWIFNEFPQWRELTIGTAQSVGRLSAEELAGSPPFDATARRAATAALVGPIVPERARAMLQSLLQLATTNPGPDDANPAVGHAWISGDTRTILAEITRTWVAVAIPFRSDVAVWKQQLLTFHVGEALRLTSPDSELVSPRVTRLAPEGFPVLLITFATDAQVANGMAARAVAVARLEIDAPADDRFFEWTRRRFRNSWLLTNTDPAVRARAMATDVGGGDLEAQWAMIAASLTLDDLADGAVALGEPRVVIYGPVLESPEQP